MVKLNQIEKVIRAYGETLESLSVVKGGRLLLSASELPFPKEVIKICLRGAIEMADDEKTKEQLKTGLMFLDDFVADKEVPEDLAENLKAWASRI